MKRGWTEEKRQNDKTANFYAYSMNEISIGVGVFFSGDFHAHSLPGLLKQYEYEG